MKEQDLADFMIKTFRPNLHRLIRDYNEAEYLKWQGNCCRQTAIIGSYFIDKHMPSYIVTAWEGNFNDILNGKPVTYDHAWIFAKDSRSDRRLLIDLARTHKDCLWMRVPSNRYLRTYYGYENMIEISRSQLDWRKICEDENETEYYTKLPTKQFIKELEKRIYSD